MSSDLVSRLLAAIDEVEQDALAVPEKKRTWWGQPGKVVLVDDDGWVVVRPVSEYSVQHIAHHDPAAVLRRCAADRTILDLHRPLSDEDVEDFLYPEAKGTCLTCGPGDSYQTRESGWCHWPCSTMKALAAGYGISVEEETTGE